MPVIIPLQSIPHQRLDIAVAGQSVTIQVDFQDVSSAFYMTLTDIDTGAIIIQNQRMNTGVNILTNKASFSGNFAVLSVTEADKPFTLDNLNTTHQLYFLTQEEIDNG